MPLTTEDVRTALRTVQDPDLHKDLVTLDMVKDIDVRDDDVRIVIELTTPACPMKDKIHGDIVRAVQHAATSKNVAAPEVDVEFTAEVRRPTTGGDASPLPDVKHVIAVGAGKGGVGKSTISVALAVGLARQGAAVGLLDGDIYGPSIPTMLGLDDVPADVDGQSLIPFDIHGIKAMTIGKLVPPDKALIWRGPMAHGAFKQLALQTRWGALDYLIVDLPPGTGDVPLTLSQLLPLTGSVVVCTPQKVAQDDARRAVRMFQQLGVAPLGLVENMSYFIGDDGKEYDIFGRGGAQMLAQSMNLPFLGAMPLHMKLREYADAGTPLEQWSINDTMTTALDELCAHLAQQVSINAMSGKFVQPTLSVH